MLALYQAEGCGYSQSVRETMTELGLSYIVHNPRTPGGDVRNEQALEDLLELGGTDQIPFLVDHNRQVKLYVSDEIIGYLETHYGEG